MPPQIYLHYYQDLFLRSAYSYKEMTRMKLDLKIILFNLEEGEKLKISYHYLIILKLVIIIFRFEVRRRLTLIRYKAVACRFKTVYNLS